MTVAVPADIEVFLRQRAPDDVQATVRWLLDHGYDLAGHPSGGRSLSTFGSALVFVGDAEVTVTVDRGQ